MAILATALYASLLFSPMELTVSVTVHENNNIQAQSMSRHLNTTKTWIQLNLGLTTTISDSLGLFTRKIGFVTQTKITITN